jgi:hypothetical protein
MKEIGKAMAGHAFRVQKNKKAKKYDNSLTDLVNLVIAQVKAEKSIKDSK